MRQLPPHFSVQERTHALAMSYKTSTFMHEVNYITITCDRSHPRYRDLSGIDNDSLQSMEEKETYFLYIYRLLTKGALFRIIN